MAKAPHDKSARAARPARAARSAPPVPVPAVRRPDPPPNAQGACRVHVHYSGRVQGVGMRATIAALAPQYAVTGCVRNLPDGRVEMLAEGERENLERFLAAIAEEMSHYLQRTERVWEMHTGEWKGFETA